MSKPTFRSGVSRRPHPAETMGAPAAPTQAPQAPAAPAGATPKAKAKAMSPTPPAAAARPTKGESPQQFPLWTRVDVAQRLREATLGRRVRFVDVIVDQLDEHADQLDRIVEGWTSSTVKPSPLFGTKRVPASTPPAMVQVTVQGLTPSERKVIEDLAAKRSVTASQLITAVLDHGLPPAD